MSNVAIFDLDHTLISTDCTDYWAKDLYKKGLIKNPIVFIKKKKKFDYDYRRGNFNILECAKFVIDLVEGQELALVEKQVNSLASTIVENFTYLQGMEAIKYHKMKNDDLLLISASLDFLVKSIGKKLGFVNKNIIGIKPIVENGLICDSFHFPLSFGQGKVECYQKWLLENKKSSKNSFFYSDSINDLPLLSFVSNPICINPCIKLKKIAEQKKWKINEWTIS